MGSYLLETERLYIRPWEKTDTKHFLAMGSDIGFNCFSPPGFFTVENEEEALTRVNRFIQMHEESKGGKFLLFEKQTERFVGLCGVGPYLIDEQQVFELGYRLMLEHWDKGYASESAKRMLQYGQEEMDKERIVAFALRQNRGSLRIIQKLGFERCGTMTHVGLEHELFETHRKIAPRLQPFDG